MKEERTESIQNRFTAYLVTAVSNAKITYIKKENRLTEREYMEPDLLERKYTEFEIQFQSYLTEYVSQHFKEWHQIQEMLQFMENDRLLKAISYLKEKERRILFARIYGEYSFAEIGSQLGLTTKQAEASYYYAVRKIRKELE